MELLIMSLIKTINNLINICETCHNKIHNENKEYKISKSNNGYVLLEI